jgi:hypothetical protein
MLTHLDIYRRLISPLFAQSTCGSGTTIKDAAIMLEKDAVFEYETGE